MTTRVYIDGKEVKDVVALNADDLSATYALRDENGEWLARENNGSAHIVRETVAARREFRVVIDPC